MTGIVWKLNRLRAMSPGEILHRGIRWVALKFEQIAVATGWVPAPSVPVTPRVSLFPQVEGWQSAWSSLYQIDYEKLDLLASGKVDFFSGPPLDVGNPVNWHRDPATGVCSPLTFGKNLNYRIDTVVGNVKLVWELGRHQHLVPLAVAYARTGDPRYRNAISEQIDGWIKDNPYGYGIHWCSALEVALRLISWAVVHSLLVLRDGESGLFSAVSNSEKLGNNIYQQAYFVRNYLSRFSSANNHLIGELTGLWVACQVFDMGEQGARWAKFSQQAIDREAQRQVYADGVDKEQAFYYHLWVLEYLLFAWLTGERSGRTFSTEFRDQILSMANFLRRVTPPGGKPPQVGDSDDGFVTRFEPTWPSDPYGDVLAAVTWTAGRDGLPVPECKIPQKAFWYAMILSTWPLTVSEKKQVSENGQSYPVIYIEGGYAILGDKTTHLVFDAGALGYPSIAAHGHADALSFCLALNGEWWLVDPGTYAYHSEPRWRDYFRGTAAHNTLTLDSRSQSEMAGPFLWVKHADAKIEGTGVGKIDHQWAEGSHTGYSNIGITHRRKLEFFPGEQRIQVSDFIDGVGIHEIAIHFHFAPDINVSYDLQKKHWIAKKQHSARMLVFNLDKSWRWEAARGSETPILGWYSPALGVKLPADTLCGHWQGPAPKSLISTIQII